MLALIRVARRPQLLTGGRLQDLLLALLALAIIALMVLPLPPALLDALITANLGLTVLLLMLALYVRHPLALSTFPTLLLLTTLLRLSLNIASTRSILLHAQAGQIIDTFGRLVVGGSVVVGLVVFLIIAIVQFIVIAKGAERIAEVGARFTLDALPGKQMSIEAELRAGLIDRETSQMRRAVLQRESHLYGAMDGAMKFVKGDAIAGLLIALVNLLAGLSVGVAIHGLPWGDSLATYTVLTVGDGLVSQIPSLFVSMAAGLLITRVADTSEGEANDADGGAPAQARAQPEFAGLQPATHQPSNLAREIGAQLTCQPKALLVTGAVLFAGVWVPGFPKWPFLVGSTSLLAAGLAVQRASRHRAQPPIHRHRALQRDGPTRFTPGHSRALAQECGGSLTLALSPSFQAAIGDGQLVAEVERARQEVTQRLGLPFPGVSVELDARLPTGHFRLEFDEVPVTEARAEVSDIGAALRQVLRSRASSLLGLQETRNLLDQAERSDPELVAEAHRLIPMTRTLQVLRRLVAEEVPIRNLRAILHALVEWAPREKDPNMLTEHVRHALAPQLTWQYGGSARTIRAIDLAIGLESTIRSAIKTTTAGNYLALEAPRQAEIAAQVVRFVEAAAAARTAQPDATPVCVLTALDVRRYVRHLLEPFAPGVAVLSFQDLSPDVQIVSAGTVDT